MIGVSEDADVGVQALQRVLGVMGVNCNTP